MITWAGAFIGGLLTLLAPCSAALLPAFFAYAFTSRRTLLARTGLFFLGLLVAVIPLGTAAGFLGSFLRDNTRTISVVGGLIIATLGLWMALALPVPHFQRRQKVGAEAGVVGQVGAGAVGPSSAGMSSAQSTGREPGSPLAVFLLGVTYGLAAIGCAGPILGAVLAVASLGGSALAGAVTMFFYAAGMFTPVLVLALLWDVFDLSGKKWLQPKPLRFLGRDTTIGALISGAIFMVLGLSLVFVGSFNIMPALLDPGSQTSLEQQVMDAFAAVPDWLFGLLLVVIVALIVAVAVQRNQRRR